MTDPKFDSARFRQVLGHFPTGVSVVAGMHEGEPVRAAMQQRFREVLGQVQADRGVPWLEVRGTPDERLTAAVAAVDTVVAAGWDLAAPLG